MWCGSMDNGHRDPEEVGYQWAAWWALRGDEPLERVHECASDLQAKVGGLLDLIDEGDHQTAGEVIAATHLFLIAIEELLNPDGTSQFKAEIKHRKRGKPNNRHERALRGRQAAAIVQRLVDEGWKQEAAIAQAGSEIELSRAEIMTWLAIRREEIRRRT